MGSFAAGTLLLRILGRYDDLLLFTGKKQHRREINETDIRS